MGGKRQLRTIGKLSGGPLIWLTTNIFGFLAAPFRPRDPRLPPQSNAMQWARIVGQCVFVLVVLGALMWAALTLAL